MSCYKWDIVKQSWVWPSYTGWVKKNVICGAWRKIVPFLFNSPLWCFFNIFWKFVNFFGNPMAQKKIREPFFLSKSKVQKSKNVYINYFYRNLKFCKDWITESQKNRNIVRRKFAFLICGQIVKKKFFKFSSSFLLSLFKS